MKILVIHNLYRQSGGEDSVARAECELLRAHDHTVILHTVTNNSSPVLSRLNALRGSWNVRQYRRVRAHCGRLRPDVAHVHNFWYTLSPSVFAACHDAGVPTVFTLHNFRLACVNGLLVRNGIPCEDCVGRDPGLGVKRGCYHGSRLHSWLVARMIRHNRARGTWQTDVDRFIAVSPFCRDVFVRAGLPAGRIAVKPNFTDRPTRLSPKADRRGALFVGRLSDEKGLGVLLEAWRRLPDVPLHVVGTGPLEAWAKNYIAENAMRHVRLLGQQGRADVLALTAQAACLVMPSIWYETFGLVGIEAFACGTPVVASDLGSLAEIVDHGRTGLRFAPGDPQALAAAVRDLLSDPVRSAQMGRNALAEYEAKYTPERNYGQLMDIYQQAIESFGQRRKLRQAR